MRPWDWSKIKPVACNDKQGDFPSAAKTKYTLTEPRGSYDISWTVEIDHLPACVHWNSASRLHFRRMFQCGNIVRDIGSLACCRALSRNENPCHSCANAVHSTHTSVLQNLDGLRPLPRYLLAAASRAAAWAKWRQAPGRVRSGAVPVPNPPKPTPPLHGDGIAAVCPRLPPPLLLPPPPPPPPPPLRSLPWLLPSPAPDANSAEPARASTRAAWRTRREIRARARPDPLSIAATPSPSSGGAIARHPPSPVVAIIPPGTSAAPPVASAAGPMSASASACTGCRAKSGTDRVFVSESQSRVSSRGVASAATSH